MKFTALALALIVSPALAQDRDGLQQALRAVFRAPPEPALSEAILAFTAQRYGWERIGRLALRLYGSLPAGAARGRPAGRQKPVGAKAGGSD